MISMKSTISTTCKVTYPITLWLSLGVGLHKICQIQTLSLQSCNELECYPPSDVRPYTRSQIKGSIWFTYDRKKGLDCHVCPWEEIRYDTHLWDPAVQHRAISHPYMYHRICVGILYHEVFFDVHKDNLSNSFLLCFCMFCSSGCFRPCVFDSAFVVIQSFADFDILLDKNNIAWLCWI
jgi:hypothetical protein